MSQTQQTARRRGHNPPMLAGTPEHAAFVAWHNAGRPDPPPPFLVQPAATQQPTQQPEDATDDPRSR